MTSSLRNDSRAVALVAQLAPLGREAATRVLRAMWGELSVLEQAALTADWSFWSRSKQRAPAGDWRTWGFLTGRGFGKTISVSNWVNDEVEAGRARLICLLAQDEDSSIDLQVNGPSGLIATAPPWFRPSWEASAKQLVWPNGARAYVRTPEVPGKIRGLEYQLTWMCELQSWPNSTRQESFDNVFLSTRLGYARVVWDATPKKRHPLLRELLARHAEEPKRHVVVRGGTYENRTNLAQGYVEDLEKKFKGTQRGREELLGEMLEDSELATAKQEWIDAKRRPMPSAFARRVISIDPAVTNKRGSDTTGLLDLGLGTDGQGYVVEDASGKMDPGVWATKTLDWYVTRGCDLVLAETNKGGQLVVQNLRVLAQAKGLEVIVVGKDERPARVPGKVFVKELYARGSKEDRAEPVGTAYERGRISHVVGVNLTSLEDTLTTWEATPGSDSPGDLDALVHGMVELLDLSKNTPDAKAGFVGISEMSKQLSAPVPAVKLTTSLAHVFGGAGRGDRI